MDTDNIINKQKEYYKKYYQKNHDERIKYQQEYYKKNYKVIQEKCCEYNKKYRAINRERINKHAREMYWIKIGKPENINVPKYVKHVKYNKPKKTKIKDLSKLQKKTHDIETALADLLVKKQEFILKLDAEKG